MCVSTCQADFVLLRTCLALFSTNCGVDFWKMGDFSVLNCTSLPGSEVYNEMSPQSTQA